MPFEEDGKDASIWFLDHTYHENMFGMFRKINARERVVGWYCTGRNLKDSDLAISELLGTYCSQPILVMVDVQPQEDVLPTKAYYSVDEIKDSGTEKAKKVFQHVTCGVGAYEAEEIGVEHLLRDVKDATISTLSTEISAKMSSLRGLKASLEEIKKYLELVQEKKLPPNNEILGYLQDIFNLLPNLELEGIGKHFAVKTNDMMMVMYISMLVRSVLAQADPPCRVKLVRASIGKRARAEPVAALYEQGRVLHCGAFAALEEELMALGSGDLEHSPDRADALVWAVSELMLGEVRRPRLRAL